MAGSLLEAANVIVLGVLIVLGALLTYISISMLWFDLRRLLHLHRPKKEYSAL